ncbi:MAG TPA: hypothetical protein VFO31_15035 [Vicinamibacterales bacterium]|nr:hypothetical protein [Vicinamibacterales bacterium]
MRSRRAVLALAVALTAPSVLAFSAGQLFVPTGGHTLRSLPGVEVIIETIPVPLQRAGLTQAAVKADLERWLGAGGVTVYQSQPANPSAAKAYLDLRTTVLALRDGSYAVAVQMHVRQTVRSLATESSIVNAATWETGRLVNVAQSDLPRVRDEIRAMAEEFVAEWKGAHP